MGNQNQVQQKPSTPEEFKNELLRVKKHSAKLSYANQNRLDTIKKSIIERVSEGYWLNDYDYYLGSYSEDEEVIQSELDKYKLFFRASRGRHKIMITLHDKIDEHVCPFDDFSKKLLDLYKQFVQVNIQRIQQQLLDAVKEKKPTFKIALNIPNHFIEQIRNYFIAIGNEGFVVSDRKELIFNLNMLNDENEGNTQIQPDKGHEEEGYTPPSAPSL